MRDDMALTLLTPACPRCFTIIRRPTPNELEDMETDLREPQAVGCTFCTWTGRALFAVETRIHEVE